MVERPEPTFLGYGVKQVQAQPELLEWLKCPRVRQVCSVSRCVSPEPYTDERYRRWEFNDSGWYDTPELARRDAAPGTTYDVFAYELFPLEFDGEGVRSVAVDVILSTDTRKLPAGPEEGFEFLGFDAVSGRYGRKGSPDIAGAIAGFDCSPLSCNGEASKHPVNDHCLLDGWDDAVLAAARFAAEEPEPGPYFILGVYALRREQPQD